MLGEMALAATRNRIRKPNVVGGTCEHVLSWQHAPEVLLTVARRKAAP